MFPFFLIFLSQPKKKNVFRVIKVLCVKLSRRLRSEISVPKLT